MKTGYTSKSTLVAPVIADNGDVIAVIQALNKFERNNKSSVIPFQDEDVQMIKSFCEGISS